MRNARAPRLADCGESVIVDRNNAIAATPSIEKVMNAMAAAVRQAICPGRAASRRR